MLTHVLASLPCMGEIRRSPEANSSMLTTSPLSRRFPFTQVFGRETIIVDPPVSWSFRKSPSLNESALL